MPTEYMYVMVVVYMVISLAFFADPGMLKINNLPVKSRLLSAVLGPVAVTLLVPASILLLACLPVLLLVYLVVLIFVRE
jgi:hypothetical protein